MKKQIGFYEPFTQEKGKNEAFIEGIKEGDLFWTVYLGEGCSYDTVSQFQAEVIGRLARIEDKLKKRNPNLGRRWSDEERSLMMKLRDKQHKDICVIAREMNLTNKEARNLYTSVKNMKRKKDVK